MTSFDDARRGARGCVSLCLRQCADADEDLRAALTEIDAHHLIRPASRRIGVIAALLAGVAILGNAGFAMADEERAQEAAQPSTEELMRRLQAMEQRVKMLEGKLKQKSASAVASTAPAAGAPAAPGTGTAVPGSPAKPAAPAGAATTAAAAPPEAPPRNPEAPPKSKDLFGLVDSPLPGLTIGAYGEVKFGAFQNPAAGGQWQNGFDAHRLVLLPTYQITPNIIFNAEIEFEHAGSAFDADDKVHGTAEVEQIWVDFKIVDQLNWRAPGIDLIPIGYINQHHEPTQFYSVNRPELYNGLIPSTWKAPATSIYGRIADGLSYQIQVSTSLEDFGGDFATRTAANTVPPFPTGYPPGIDGLNGLGFSRPVLGSFAQLSDDLAVAAKLDYAPPFIPGFAASTSVYWTPNVTPRGAYADTGDLLGRSSLTMFDTEFRYRFPNIGLEARGEYVLVTFGNPANLRANNDTDPTNNVGKTMYGWSGELAWHIPMGTILGSEWEAVPFYRYTYQNLQTSGFAGTDLDLPTGAGQTTYHTTGIAIFPSPKLVLKATYQRVINRDPAGANADSVLGAVGIFF
jgi:hypothetical protein